MFRQIINLGVINGFTAFLGFISTFLIVEFLGISILGEFALFKSYLAVGGLIFTIIPPNYSIFQLQDNENFKQVLIDFYLLISFVFVFYAFFLNLLLFSNISIHTIYLFGITIYWQGYFDIKHQSSGKVKKYFYMLLMMAFFKILLLFVFYYFNLLNSLEGLLWVNIIGQGTIITYYLIGERSAFKNTKLNYALIKNQILFIRTDYSTFKNYYLNTILKRLRENSLVLVFGNILTSETIGLFVLFVKIDSFVLGLGRMIEAFIMNRRNLAQLKASLSKTAFQFAAVLQFLFLMVGVTYMKVIVNQFYFIELFMQSLLVYPYVYYLLARVEVLSHYNNRGLNISELMYLFVAVFGFTIGLLFEITSIYIIFLTYLLARLGLQLYLIIATRGNGLAVSSVVSDLDDQGV